MILTMKFNMEDDEDRAKFNEMNDARDMAIAINAVYQLIRSKLKYSNPSLSEETCKVLEEVREELSGHLHGCKTEF